MACICPKAILLVIAIAPANAFAQGGGLDSYGCHNDRKHAGYHCHKGQLSGKSFAFKAEMSKQFGGKIEQSSPKKQ
jgi:hypothetical protein